MLRCLPSVSLIALLSVGAAAQNIPPSTQAGSGQSTITGCVQKSGGIYTLNDESSKNTFQLRGGNLRNGKHVQVTGSAQANAAATGGATQVIDVASVKSVSGSCQSRSAGGPGKSFMSRGTVASIGIIGGVAAVAVWATVSRIGEARGGK